MLHVGGVCREVDELELEPRGLADQLLQLIRILNARDLDEDSVAALGNDGDFLCAARIDSAAQLIGQGSRVEGGRHDKCRDARHSRARGMRFVGKKENPVDDTVDGIQLMV